MNMTSLVTTQQGAVRSVDRNTKYPVLSLQHVASGIASLAPLNGLTFRFIKRENHTRNYSEIHECKQQAKGYSSQPINLMNQEQMLDLAWY
jgi:hypothetical protein